jgi:hypothetical protein
MIWRRRAVWYAPIGAFVLLFLANVPSSVIASSPVTFGAIVNLSNNSGASTAPAIAAVGANVYVAWTDKSAGHPMTFFRASPNGGSKWGSTIQFNQPGSAHAVQIAASGSNVFLVWDQGSSIAFAASSDSGSSFGPMKNLSVGLPAGSSQSSAIAASGNDVYVTWAFNSTSGESDVELVAGHDGGVTFTSPLAVRTGFAEEDQVSVSGNCVYVVGDSIWFRASCDKGVTWSPEIKLNAGQNPPGCYFPTCAAREPMIAVSGSDVYVTWPANGPLGLYHAYIAVSNDNGAHFVVKDLSPGFKSAREIQVASCTSSNLQVPCSSTKDVFVTFRGQLTTSTVNQYVVVSHDEGATFAAPVNVANQKGAQVGFGGLGVDGNNIYVQWPHAGSNGVSQIFIQSSQDDGATWGGVQQVSASTSGAVGLNDPGDQGPMVAASGGHVYVVWQDGSSGKGDIYFRAG